jgi:hypothetical protein
MSLTEAFEAAVGLADLGAEAAADEILELLVAPETEHLLTAADGVFELQIVVNEAEKLVELVSFLAGKDIDQFICNMVRDSTGETCLANRSGSSRGSHRRANNNTALAGLRRFCENISPSPYLE